MSKIHPHVPIGLPIAAVLLLILGIIAGPQIRSAFSEETLARNVLLNAIPFILIFLAIILIYITLIRQVAGVLNSNIPARLHRLIEVICTVGIVLGVVGMFQPWWFAAYRIGFLVLLVSTLAYILWSHVIPKEVRRQEHLGSARATDAEKRKPPLQVASNAVLPKEMSKE